MAQDIRVIQAMQGKQPGAGHFGRFGLGYQSTEWDCCGVIEYDAPHPPPQNPQPPPGPTRYGPPGPPAYGPPSYQSPAPPSYGAPSNSYQQHSSQYSQPASYGPSAHYHYQPQQQPVYASFGPSYPSSSLLSNAPPAPPTAVLPVQPQRPVYTADEMAVSNRYLRAPFPVSLRCFFPAIDWSNESHQFCSDVEAVHAVIAAAFEPAFQNQALPKLIQTSEADGPATCEQLVHQLRRSVEESEAAKARAESMILTSDPAARSRVVRCACAVVVNGLWNPSRQLRRQADSS